ncbi:RNA transcription, translation and transport factor protein-like [Xenia sp. Carnegie-2017]|uniref:RNA transcription, translation and transport factor protein-like n=1 Tax=Xenia sp. Carnegie-2017 TaxID=2897299 RepID=UPI001F04C078|nr:RNA transcription, translation and transport factor protein-like [Xenia sp. Carnegie-2017]XP_046848255.1 RNA transcription, translation and transport factor protein-like [Xenia sp. Carnegie-2017]
MFSRKLKALGYHSHDCFDVNEQKQFSAVIVWLEDIKIRLYKIEERTLLRATDHKDWPLAFKQYIADLECPVNSERKEQVLDWLLGHAIRLEYADKASQINEMWMDQKARKQHQKNNSVETEDSIWNIQVDDPNLKAGILSLASMLKIPEHDDLLLKLQAIRAIIENKMTPESQANATSQKKSDLNAKFLQNMSLGFDTGDSAVNEAAKILRLLHVSELRELQTSITQAIVAVQSHTANPKTDTKLGKVGV